MQAMTQCPKCAGFNIRVGGFLRELYYSCATCDWAPGKPAAPGDPSLLLGTFYAARSWMNDDWDGKAGAHILDHPWTVTPEHSLPAPYRRIEVMIYAQNNVCRDGNSIKCFPGTEIIINITRKKEK